MTHKISAEHVQALREAMQPFLNKTTAEIYAEQGFSEKRYRWGAFWAATRHSPSLRAVVDEIYKTCNDDHLGTIFRKLARERNNVEVAPSVRGTLV